MEISLNEHLIHELKLRLKGPLPGKKAQYAMAPFGRDDEAASQYFGDPKMSAVLLLLYEFNARPFIILIKRPDYRGIHGGQVSFPGGKMENIDNNLQDTAIRESQEEIGLLPDKLELLGCLTPLYIPPSNYWVYPFVGYCEQLPYLSPSHEEVEKIIKADLTILLDPRAVRKGRVKAARGRSIEAPYFLIGGHVVWGATAMILKEFSFLLN